MSKLTGLGIASAFVLALSFAAGSAQAFVGAPLGASVGIDAAGSLVTPVAMCGRSCRNGGRYIPGPPSVCADEGLNYCGSSRGGGGGGAVVVIPGTGVGIVGGGGGGRSCRTVTTRRSDGSVTTVRRCD